MSKNESLPVSIIDSNYSDTGCDESKCFSTGLTAGSFTCYYNDWNPIACSHGYQPHRVNSEPVVWSEEFKAGTRKTPSMPSHYFTCCPPDLPPNTNVTRDCSSPIQVIHSNTTDICDDDTTQPYSRKMANIGPMESHMCCSTLVGNSHNETISFLNDTECVPFQNSYHAPATIKNLYGFNLPVMCDNKGIYKECQMGGVRQSYRHPSISMLVVSTPNNVVDWHTPQLVPHHCPLPSRRTNMSTTG